MAAFGNQYALGNNGGRPRHYTDPEEMQARIDEYFIYIQGEKGTDIGPEGKIEEWKREPEYPTVTGLALYLGFAGRNSLNEYEKLPEFSYLIKRAKSAVENGYEKALRGTSPTGSIFALKNMGWADRHEITGAGETPLFSDKSDSELLSSLHLLISKLHGQTGDNSSHTDGAAATSPTGA